MPVLNKIIINNTLLTWFYMFYSLCMHFSYKSASGVVFFIEVGVYHLRVMFSKSFPALSL